jgi:hypothetical protein
MEEPREQCTVVFATIVTEPAKGRRRGVQQPNPHPLPPPHTLSLDGSVTVDAKTTVHCSPGSSMMYMNYSQQEKCKAQRRPFRKPPRFSLSLALRENLRESIGYVDFLLPILRGDKFI